MAESVIKIEGVTKTFGRAKALEDVSFEVPERSIFGLLGPNGAGKTTLFSVVANFLRADAGSVKVLGLDARQTSKLQGRLTILPQDALFQRNLSILDQLVFFRRLGGVSKTQAKDDAMEALKIVGLSKYARRSARILSHGMTKRLGIAQAVMGEPEVVLLDEPTAGLDPKNARHVRDLVRKFQKTATVVVSSHNLAEIQELCDHAAILDHGKLVSAGPVADMTRGGGEVEFRLSRDLTEEEVEALGEIEGVGGWRQMGPGRWAASLALSSEGASSDADAVLAGLLRGLLKKGVTPREMREGATLEQHFLRMTNKKATKEG